jgi:hypothetical protein
MGFFELVGRVASTNDKILLASGLSAAGLFGGSMPAFCLFFGEMIDDMGGSGDQSGFDSLKT